MGTTRTCGDGHHDGVFYVRAWPDWDLDGHSEPSHSTDFARVPDAMELAGAMAIAGAHSSVEVFHSVCDEAIWYWSSTAGLNDPPIPHSKLTDLAAAIAAWDARYGEISHRENHEGGAFGAWAQVDDAATDIVRDLQELLERSGYRVRAPQVRRCPAGAEPCEQCTSADQGHKP